MERNKNPTLAPAPPSELQAVAMQLRAAIEPTRAYALSLHDAAANILWLSESSMGPDEHNAVHIAAETFRDQEAPPLLTQDLGDSRAALLLRAFGAQRATLGIAMLIVDSRAIQRGAEKFLTPALQRALAEFTRIRITATANQPTSPVARRRVAELPVTPEIDRLNAALRKSPINLHVQRLVPLTKGSTLKRFEVLLRAEGEKDPNVAPEAMLKTAVRNGLGSMIDRRVVSELIGWLVRNPAVWKDNSAMFSVNLTTTALHDEHFIKFVELCMSKASLPTGVIAFEVDVATAIKPGTRIADVAAAMHRIGCPLILDDFTLSTECLALLRLTGVRLLKMAPSLTAQMRTDKISQASITAVAQMARVLGIHTVAKRTESSAEQEWLTALGIDFVQSNAFSPPVAIESLSIPAVL